MFRRSTKLTALLVAATSVASMTPVMAANKLNQKDATVKTAVAFDGGKYAYYGYRGDDKDTGIYYNAKSKDDKFVDEDALEEYEIKEKYGTKYAYVTEDGNKDEYLVDLSTGKIADDETAEDKQESAQAKLISNLKKAERYNTTSDTEYRVSSDNTRTNRLFRNQFGDVWYQYAVVTTEHAENLLDNQVLVDTDSNDSVYSQSQVTTDAAANVQFGAEDANSFTGFVSESGKYIDASYIANVKVYNPRKDKATLIEKFGHLYKDEALRVDLKGIKPLAQDKNYIYTLTTVDVTYYKCDEHGSYIYDLDKAAEKGLTPDVERQYYVQKISKTQGDKEDGAYVPKSVDSYLVGSENTLFDDFNDENTAFDLFNGEVSHYRNTNVLYAVKDGELYATYLESDGKKVKTHKIKLGKEKLDVDKDCALIANKADNTQSDFRLPNKPLYKQGRDGDEDYRLIGLDIDIPVAKSVEDDDFDYDIPEAYKAGHYPCADDDVMAGISIDTEGNTWVVYHGKIAVFDKSEFKEEYKTDRSYDRLDVYNKDSLVAWSQDTESYTTVQEGKEQTVSDAKDIDSNLVDKTTITPAKTPGWEKQADGTWMLYDVTGNKVTGWANVGGVWYYMDPATGIMKTGWLNDNGTWYYLEGSGAMKTGWLNDNGTWYYLNGNGSMATGWLNDNGTWYYLNSNGSMASNTYVDGYWLNGSGAWVK